MLILKLFEKISDWLYNLNTCNYPYDCPFCMRCYDVLGNMKEDKIMDEDKYIICFKVEIIYEEDK